MLGWIRCGEGKRRLHTEMETVCGVPFLLLEAACPRHRWERRRLHRTLNDMLSRGIRRVVAEGTGAAELLEGTALQPVDCGPLRRVLLPQLLDRVEEDWNLPLERCAVRLSARQTDGDTMQAACVLARRARYLLLDTGVGQEVLEKELQRRFGLGRAGGTAVLEVCLGGERRGGAPVLYLGEEGWRRQELELWSPLLTQGPESAFSAIFQAGKLRISDIAVKSLEFCA